MEDSLEPLPRTGAARRRRTALLAALVALLLSAPLEFALKKRQAVVPDTDDGFKPIGAISGLVREAPRVQPAARPPETPRPAASLVAELASMISLPAPEPDPSFWRVPPPPPESAREPARRVTVAKKIPERKRSASRARAQKAGKPNAVAPPLFAKSEDFSDLEFSPPAAPAPALKAPRPLSPSAVEPVAVPDRLDLILTKDDRPSAPAPARSAVIVERVPSN